MISEMKKCAALPVRLTEHEKTELTTVACATGLTVSTIVRLLIESFIHHYHENNGKFELPLSWKKILHEGT